MAVRPTLSSINNPHILAQGRTDAVPNAFSTLANPAPAFFPAVPSPVSANNKAVQVLPTSPRLAFNFEDLTTSLLRSAFNFSNELRFLQLPRLHLLSGACTPLEYRLVLKEWKANTGTIKPQASVLAESRCGVIGDYTLCWQAAHWIHSFCRPLVSFMVTGLPDELLPITSSRCLATYEQIDILMAACMVMVPLEFAANKTSTGTLPTSPGIISLPLYSPKLPTFDILSYILPTRIRKPQTWRQQHDSSLPLARGRYPSMSRNNTTFKMWSEKARTVWFGKSIIRTIG